MRFIEKASQTLNTQFLKLEAIKTVVQNHRPEPKLLDLAERFRQMVNLSITIRLERGRTSLKSLCLVSYHRLKSSRLHPSTVYVLSPEQRGSSRTIVIYRYKSEAGS